MERLREQKEEQMNTFRQNVILVQPKATEGMKKEEFIKRKPFRKILIDLEKLNLVHFSTIKLLSAISKVSRCYEIVETPVVVTCGGDISVNNLIGDSRSSEFRSRAKEVIGCSSCNLELGIDIKRKSLGEILVHLLLKQFIPDLSSSNYVDLRKFGMGVMSIYGSWQYGKIKEDNDSDLRHYLIGLSLLPNESLDTIDGNDGMDSWLRYLFLEERKKVDSLLQEFKHNMLGPKPNYNLAGIE